MKFPIFALQTKTNLLIHERFAQHNKVYLQYLKLDSSSSKSSNPAEPSSIEDSITTDIEFKSLLEQNNFNESMSSLKELEGGESISVNSDIVKHNITILLNSAKNKALLLSDLRNILVRGSYDYYYISKNFDIFISV